MYPRQFALVRAGKPATSSEEAAVRQRSLKPGGPGRGTGMATPRAKASHRRRKRSTPAARSGAGKEGAAQVRPCDPQCSNERPLVTAPTGPGSHLGHYGQGLTFSNGHIVMRWTSSPGTLLRLAS